MRLEDFDYVLPEERIAQHPVEPRDSARLLVDQGSAAPLHRHVRDLGEFLRDGDLLVVNDTKVIPARLRLQRASGGAAEALLLEPLDAERRTWEAMVRPAKKLKAGEELLCGGVPLVRVLRRSETGDTMIIELVGDGDPLALLAAIPHRFFFLSGVSSLALAALWWAWTRVARMGYAAPPAAVAPSALHAFLMVYGFAPFFMFGFLFTAGPRWLGVEPPPSAAWRPAGVAAAVAVLSLLPLQVAPAWATQLAAGVYALAWAVLLFRFVSLIRPSTVADKVHARLVAFALPAGCAGAAAFAIAGPAAHAIVRLLGVWMFLLPVFVVVCHRMIPFFTANVVPFVTSFRPWWLLAAMVAAPVAHGLVECVIAWAGRSR